MNTITRHCINSNFKLHVSDSNFDIIQVIEYKELCDSINFWKMFLIETYNVKPGERAFIFGQPGLHYYSATFAALELGMVLVIDWPHCYNEEDLHSHRTTMFGTIDLILSVDLGYRDDPRNPANFKWDHKRNKMFGRNVVGLEDFNAYTVKDHSKFQQVADTMLCTPDSPIVDCATSGTTNTPTRVISTHKEIYAMSKRLVGLLKFTEDEKVLHTHNVHHGIAMCLHLLPSLMQAHNHYVQDLTNLAGLTEFVNKEKINRLFLFTTKILTDYLTATKPVDHPVTALVLYQITPDIIKLFKSRNFSGLVSSFGDTSIGAGFFIKEVPQTIELDSYDVGNFGPVRDDFYQFEIRDNRLFVACPELGIDWCTSNDSFEVVDGNYCFRGRANSYRIGEEWITFADVDNKVKQLFGECANIVFDYTMQKIYLAVWEPNEVAEVALAEYFNTTYHNINISYVLRNEKIDQFVNGRKVDSSKIRDYCRTRLNLN